MMNSNEITAAVAAGVIGLGSLKINGLEILLAPAALAVMTGDPSACEHGDRHCHEFAGWPMLSGSSVTASDDNRQIVRQIGQWNESSIILDIVTGRDMNGVELRFDIDWREKQQVLKLEIPTRLRNSVNFSGIDELQPDGREHPLQDWTAIAGTLAGQGGCVLQLVSRDIAVYDCQGPVLRLIFADGESVIRLIPYDHAPSVNELSLLAAATLNCQ